MSQQNGAQASLRWALQTIATELKVEVDTERLHSITRAALTAEHGGTITKSQIIDAARALRLEAVSEEGTLLSSAQADTALPLIALTGAGLLVVSGSRGSTVHVFRQGGPPGGEWLDAAAFGAAYPGQLPMVRFSSAAPMQDLAAVSHHATPWQRLAALMHLERDDLNVIVIYAVAVGVLSLATPIAVQALVTTVAFGKLLQPVVVLALMLMATLAFAAVLKALQAQVVETLQQRLFVRTALDLAWRLPKAHRAQADSGFGPEAVNRFFDVVTLQKTSALLLTDGVAAALQMTLGLLVLAFYHPALLALDLLIVASAVALVALPFRRGLKTSLDESRGKYAVAAWLQELSRTSSSFRSTAGGMLATETAEVLTRNYLSGRRRHFSVVFGQTAASLALQVIASATLLGVGGWLVLREQLTLGQLVAAELIVTTVTASIARSGKLLDSTYDLLTSLDKLGHLVDVPLDPLTVSAVPGTGALTVRAAGASDGTGSPALSFHIDAGARAALVAPAGTLAAEWLCGLRPSTRGSLELAGADTGSLSPPACADSVALVRCDDVFDGSVEDNVTLRTPGVSALEVQQALEAVGLASELRRLGLTPGSRVIPATTSRSFRLRLMVARALARRPRLIVLDEQLEGLAQAERAQVISALMPQSREWTLVAIVQDPGSSTARACDEVIVMNPSSDSTSGSGR